jgi:hypothetical protein
MTTSFDETVFDRSIWTPHRTWPKRQARHNAHCNFPYPVDSKKTFRPGPKTITMTPHVPNDHLVEFVDQMAAEKLKDQTKSKPALAGGL